MTLALLCTLGAARADEAPPISLDLEDSAHLTLGVGYYDFIYRNNSAADFRVEYRHDQGLWYVKPWIGLEATSDGAFYPAGGFLLDIYLFEDFVVTPSLGVGAYFDQIGGEDLGNTLEFRTQIEVSYRFEDHARLGMAFSHISNAGIGDSNPGAEVLNLYYSLPLWTSD